ncbi:MAG TPA: endonuclease/exonuclease/phosphatase family protein [Candidatus Competibacter sp.]|nr:endonuclease [Candidatus Competibacteraceae bacterium]HUM94281.1 endonuclease/exonuclease/phosphatase family protein [Candidatus Competibacter sp.]
MFRTSVSIFGWCLVGATLLPLLRFDAWWIRIFDFPRQQIFFLIALILPVLHFWVAPEKSSDGLLAAALVACLIYQAYRMYPYTPLASAQAKPPGRASDRLRLMTANVLMDNRKSGELLSLIENVDPDIVFLVETDAWWADQLKPLRQHYPHYLEHPLENTYGLVLYSRLELIEPHLRFLIQDDIPSLYFRIKLPSGSLIDLYAIHPRPPVPGEHHRSTERDAELLVVGKQVKEANRPALVFGDLNDVAWSHTTHLFQRISGLLDPRIGRGIFATFHAQIPLLRWPLDHVFFSDDFRLAEMRVLPGVGSDHFPVLIEVSFEPEGAHQQEEPPPADAEDHQEAKETIEKAKEDN